MTSRLRDRERGSITVELVILTPIVGLLLASVVLVGRVQTARADVEGAARSAARELSIARSPASAVPAATNAAHTTLEVGSPACRTMGFTPTITASTVTVTVSCLIDLRAASVLPVPASMTVSATTTEVIDTHREAGG